MFIAQKKRAENIAEYILYLWQLEDLLRALQFSPEAIWNQLVEPQSALLPEQKQQLFMWYMELVSLLKEEGKVEFGHLQHTLHLISDMHDLHTELLIQPIGKKYREVWSRVGGELPRLKAVFKNLNVTDIEICFRALYAVMLYRIKGVQDDHSQDINDVITLISPLIAMLSDFYLKNERGEIDIYREE
jgi:hypothetical protein